MKPLAKPEEVLINPVISTTLRYSIDLKFPSSVVAVIVVVPKPTVFYLFPSIIATFSSLLVIVAFLFSAFSGITSYEKYELSPKSKLVGTFR